MATVSPVPVDDNPKVYLWEALATGDTVNYIEPLGLEPLAGFMQATGTFGSATITLQGSNDGTNFVDLYDRTGTAISLTAAGGVDFSTSARYIKPGISGGSSDDVDVHITLRA